MHFPELYWCVGLFCTVCLVSGPGLVYDNDVSHELLWLHVEPRVISSITAPLAVQDATFSSSGSHTSEDSRPPHDPVSRQVVSVLDNVSHISRIIIQITRSVPFTSSNFLFQLIFNTKKNKAAEKCSISFVSSLLH